MGSNVQSHSKAGDALGGAGTLRAVSEAVAAGCLAVVVGRRGWPVPKVDTLWRLG